MWTCPKCGREFKNQGQGHYCVKPKTIDEYIALQEKPLRPFLQDIRCTIRAALPDAEERISWSMPTFWGGKNVIQFAASKRHVGLYPGPEAVELFQDKLAGYETSKGTIRLPYQEPLPLELIEENAKWCWKQYHT